MVGLVVFIALLAFTDCSAFTAMLVGFVAYLIFDDD